MVCASRPIKQMLLPKHRDENLMTWGTGAETATSFLGVTRSVALARGGCFVGLGGSLVGGRSRVVMGDFHVRMHRRMVLEGMLVWAAWAGGGGGIGG